MNRKTLLIAGIAFITTMAVGVWLYSLLNSPRDTTGANSDGFTEFETSGEGAYNPEDNLTITDVQIENGTSDIRLRQITTNAVAGAVFANSGIYYVEQGTGHVRHLNLVTGQEVLVSGTTIPGAYEAFFSNDGSIVAITTTQDGAPKTIVAEVPAFGSTGTLDGVSLPLGAREVSLSESVGMVYYLMQEASGSKGYAYDVDSRTSVELFNVSLRDIHVLWGETIYVYTTPTSEQIGYAYRVVGDNLEYLSGGGAGLMALPFKDGAAVTRRLADGWASDFISPSRDEVRLISIVIPEKCVPGTEALFCAVPFITESTIGLPDSWYKGTVSLSDSLWQIDPIGNGGEMLLSDFLQESGRQIDVLKIGIDSIGSYLYLINKNDNTLWLYRL